MNHLISSFFLLLFVFTWQAEASAPGSISPTCLSDRPPGCHDARVYRNHLNYTYKGTVHSGEEKAIRVDDSEAWHAISQQLLKDTLRRYKAIIGKENIVLAALQIIYEKEDELRVTREYHNLPYIYFSGSMSPVVPASEGPPSKKIEIPHSVEGRPINYTITTVGDFLPKHIFPDRTPADNVALQLRPVLEGYFDRRLKPTKFEEAKIDDWYRYIQSHALSFLEQHFFHSEQALLLQLGKQTDILNPLLESLPSGSIIHQITLHIVSDRQMCRCCAQTHFRACEGAGKTKQILKDYIENYPTKHFRTAQSELNLFILSSGLISFDPPALSYRRRHNGMMNQDIKSNEFTPHIAHENLGKTEDHIVVE